MLYSPKEMGLMEAIPIDSRGIVGVDIFSVLGLTAELGGGRAYINFLVVGLVALLTISGNCAEALRELRST